MPTSERSSLDAASSIEAVQQEVAAKFQRADHKIDVRRTGYFNHTYAPDLVLNWPGEKDERHVYLRTSDSARYLAEDIDLARDRDPIFVPLSGVVDPDDNREALAVKSKRSRALIAEGESIEALAAGAGQGAIRILAARAVLQGGSGVVARDKAEQFGDAIAAGFEGALAGDAESTGTAVRESGELLDGRRTSQLAELLQAAWIGGGQIGTAFPGIGIASASIQPEALKLLLDTVAVDDMTFWSRLAIGLELPHLAGLTIADTHAGFQMLMRAAAPRLKAKGARATAIDGEPLEAPRWAVNAGRLRLAVDSARLEFVARSIDDFSAQGIATAPSVRTFVRRAQEAELNVVRVTLTSGNRRLDYASEDGTSVAGDDRLITIEGDFGQGATVVRAAVDAEGKELAVAMDTATISGGTRSIFYVSTLAQVGVPLIADLDRGARLALSELFTPE